MARVLAISSHVARGHVGLAVTVPALQTLGHEVWAVPTIVLASRPGLGQFAKHDLPPSALEAMLAALEADGCWQTLDAVFTGYFPSAASVAVAAHAIARIKTANPKTQVVVDPILGDAGKLYVATDTAEAIRDLLVPLASIATPNLFELRWLEGASTGAQNHIADAARRLGPATVVVTSAVETRGSITTLLVTADTYIERPMRVRSGIPNGAGDLFAGLLLGHLLNGRDTEAALDVSLQNLDRVLAASEGHPLLQLDPLVTSNR